MVFTIHGTPDGKFNDWKLPHTAGWQDMAEPYVDGDVNRGEPFTDLNKNGRRDAEGEDLPPDGEPFVDLSSNGAYDGPNDPWTPGVPFDDRNQPERAVGRQRWFLGLGKRAAILLS
jgi:hypothetical protein